MKPVKAVIVLLIAGVVLPLTSNAGHPRTITDIVAASGGVFDRDRNDFDILLNAVLAAELDGVLADPKADFTVFAPTDRAFIRLAREFGYKRGGEAVAFDTIVAALTELGDGDPIPLLRNILLYHVSPEGKTVHEVQAAAVIETAFTGETLLSVRKRLLDNEPDVRDPRFIEDATNIEASNGIVHAINRVLIPLDIDNTDDELLPTITGTVAASGGVYDHDRKDFDILLNAVIAADLAGALDNPSDSLTVLAPNDAAFIRTARSLGFKGHDEAGAFNFIVAALTDLGNGDPIPLLQSILLYHVLPEAQTVKQVLTADSVTTLLDGATIHPVATKRKLVDNDPNLRDPRALTFRSNIRASNGFINPISRVLIPVDLSTL
ncbi:MAG: fasciclin domain-containing protein [Pseudomonadota bacterium]